MINLQVRENGVFAEVEIGAVKQFREIKPKQLINLLSKTLYNKIEEEITMTPIVPIGTIQYKENKTNNEYFLAFYKEDRIAPIVYESREYLVGYPKSLFLFKVCNQMLIEIKAFALKTSNINNNMAVFHYPFFNVYGNGSFCLGGNRISIEEPWHLQRVPDMLTLMPNTHALANNNLSQLKGDSLLKAIENKPFPDKWLKPTNQMLKEIL